MKRIVFLLTSLLFISSIYSKKLTENKSLKLWHLTQTIGISQLVTEVEPGLFDFISEFNNKPGISSCVSLSRLIRNRWEPGMELSISTISGISQNPDFTAIGYHVEFDDFLFEPVDYFTLLISPKFRLRYYFKDIYPRQKKTYKLIPFVEVKVGAAILKTKLEYVDQTEMSSIFVKGTGRQPTPGLNAEYTFGTGVRYKLSPQWSFISVLDFNLVNYDCLDAVHNYTDQGVRIDMLGLYSTFSIGVSYAFSTRKKHNNPYNPWHYRF